VLFPCVVALAAAACAPIDPLAGISGQSGWRLHADNPVIKAGDFRNKGLWNDPSVLRENGRYIMYLTTSVQEPFQPPVLPFRAVSPDALQWRLEPDVPLLSPAGTPFVSLETPSVVVFHGQYHMYLTGIYPAGTVPPMALCHAVSADGITWTLDPQPLLTATGNVEDWNGYLVGEPGAVVVDDRIFLYFSAVGARPGGVPPQSQTIGLVTSQDGVNFDLPRIVLRQADTYPPEKGFVGYSSPSAFVLDDGIHLVVSVAAYQKNANPEWQQVALQHAVSPNGETGFVQAPQPVFTRNDFSWTSGEILAPAALVDEGKVKLWFAGHVAVNELAPLIHRGFKGPEFGIGLATIDIEQFLQNAPEQGT
jgi:hypothetical protein